jgi:elongation factor P
MNVENYEQITLEKILMLRFVEEGTNVMVQVNTETDLPLSVICQLQ